MRNELEALAVAQEEAKKAAERLGCVRFEPMEKVGVQSRHSFLVPNIIRFSAYGCSKYRASVCPVNARSNLGAHSLFYP